MPGKTIYLLSTRPLEDSLVRQAAARNMIIDTAAFIQTSPVTDDGLREQVIALAGQPATAVFTSMNAAEAVAGWLGSLRPQWKIFSIGTATRQVVQNRFGIEPSGEAAHNASALADEIIRHEIREVVFFCGDRRRDELPGKLKSHNIGVKELVVYTTSGTAQHVTGAYDGILFFSPSAVESFFSVNNVPSGTVLFAIGATTAASLSRQSANPIVTADHPGKASLVEKAIHFFNHTN